MRPVELPGPALGASAVAVVAIGATGLLSGMSGPAPGSAALTASLALAFTPFGVFVARRMPGHPLGRLMLLVGATATVATLAVCWAALLPLAWLSQWSWWPPLAVVPLLLLRTPDGLLPSPRWRPLAAVLVGASVITAVALAGAAATAPRTLLTDPYAPIPPAAGSLLVVAGVSGAVVMAATVGVLAALVIRWRGAPDLERRQLACLLPSAALLAIGVTLSVTTDLVAPWIVAVFALPIGLTVAVLRYQLHDLDLYIHRGTVWLVLTGLALVVYVGVVTALSGTVLTAGSPVASVVAAGAVAALLQPAQRFVQRGVTRMLYGRRDEPYAVLTSLGRHLEGVRDPLEVLPHIAATVVEGLRVPYAAIRLRAADGTFSTVAERGRWAGPPERFDLVAHGEQVGELLVAPRRPGSRFTAAEARLLRDLAVQTASAAEACRSAVALQQARDRLVLAREEERRRLRRDLHDGVASALVGTRMLAEVMRRGAPSAPDPALLDHLAADLDACTAEVRELIDGLRPAALDDGLGTALAGLVDRFAEPPVALTVEGDLAGLPAAVEVAGYRVVAEALTNVAKHAGARAVTLVVRRDERHLEVRVTDDGRGFDGRDGSGDGVGLSSIRDRVDELGGRCDIRSGPDGTTVDVLLPLAG